MLYSESTDLNVYSHVKNTFTAISRIMFSQISGHHGPAKLAHKINHHRKEKAVWHDGRECWTSRLEKQLRVWVLAPEQLGLNPNSTTSQLGDPQQTL